MMDVLIKFTNIRWMRSLVPASKVKRGLSCITGNVWISTAVQQKLSHWPVSMESSKVKGCETSPTCGNQKGLQQPLTLKHKYHAAGFLTIQKHESTINIYITHQL